MAEKLNVGEGNMADYTELKKAVVELSKEKLTGRAVRGRLNQPIEEEDPREKGGEEQDPNFRQRRNFNVGDAEG